MANLTRRKSGAYVVRYYDDMGSRSLFLGQIQKRSAEEILRHAERLIESRRANVSIRRRPRLGSGASPTGFARSSNDSGSSGPGSARAA